MLFGVLSALLCRISSADISHILGNLEEISIFQQMLVQSLEEHTKLVFICLQNAVHLCNSLALEFRYTKLKKKKKVSPQNSPIQMEPSSQADPNVGLTAAR